VTVGTRIGEQHHHQCEHGRPVTHVGQWADLIREQFVALDVDAVGADGFRGRVQQLTSGDVLDVSRVESVRQTFTRTPALVAEYGEHFLQVGLLERGHAELEQDGRTSRVGPGTFAVYETSRPFRWRMSTDWRLLVFTWPRSEIGVEERETVELTARTFGSAQPAERVAHAALRALGSVGGPNDRVALDHVAGQVADLVLAAGGSVRGHRDDGLKGAVVAFIEENLHCPELTPDRLAREFHLSVRTLQRAFAADGQTLSGLISARRLARACRLLRSSTRPVYEIATEVGILDPSVFSRLFRRNLGMSPSQYRQCGR
jgi:AraC-like DNA-binding protein